MTDEQEIPTPNFNFLFALDGKKGIGYYTVRRINDEQNRLVYAFIDALQNPNAITNALLSVSDGPLPFLVNEFVGPIGENYQPTVKYRPSNLLDAIEWMGDIPLDDSGKIYAIVPNPIPSYIELAMLSEQGLLPFAALLNPRPKEYWVCIEEVFRI